MTASTTTGSDRSTTAKTADTHDAKVFAPAANPAATIVGCVIGLLLLGLAVVAVRDLLVQVGWLSGSEWTRDAADGVGDLRWSDWMWPVAVALIVVGLAMIWLAAKPRRRTHLSLKGYEVMWTRRGDLARRCSTAASGLPGVDHATTVVGRRTVKLRVTVTDAADLGDIDRVVGDVLADIHAPLRAKVRPVGRRDGDRG
ncbi:DUF6286 domain-containing protein [Gordonia hankookensis]|uniref:DUF6286 domain-containing protein n=1 Tax=Gordonia hankookensis TaxID=589403 RepID=A0ABR7W9C3_9ACTN|nr:DUF6286 domain-containing protein [Gordonia hankookensis]MBD1318432.1 hypothetical protein [Gordonia hankookensis]